MEEKSFENIIGSFKPINIGNLFKNNQFFVYYNQRVYFWDEEKLEELWEDILEIMEERAKERNEFYKLYHFFGPMFFVPSCKSLKILDGQQRITTISLFLRVIYDLIDELRETGSLSREAMEISGKIKELLFDKKEGKDIKRISLGKRNESHYSKLMITNNHPLDKISQYAGPSFSKTEKRVLNCYKFFFDKIIQELINKDEKSDLKIDKKELTLLLKEENSQKFIVNLFNSIINGLYILFTSVPSEDIIYKMYETLNQRGEKLLTIDLFKNFLFEKFEGPVNSITINNFWEELIRICEEEEKLKFFLRCFYLSNYNFIREKELFNFIKEKISQERTNDENFKIITDFILKEANLYSALKDHEDIFWEDKPQLIDLIEELNYLGFTQPLPLFLSSLSISLDPSLYEFRKLLQSYLNFAVRRFTLLGENPSKFERKYSGWATDLRAGKKNVNQIVEEIKEITPFDEEVVPRIIGLKLSIKNARYILSKINDSFASELPKVWKNKPTVEHIIPKNPNSSLLKIFKEKEIDYEDLLDRLGNLTILGPSENRELGNIDYSLKRDKYLKTKIPINLETTLDVELFLEKEVEEREKKILNMIQKKNLWGFGFYRKN